MRQSRRAPGEIWLERRPDSPFWYICFYDPARRKVRRISTRTADRAAAERARAEWVLGRERAAPAEPTHPPMARVPTLGEVLDAYLEYSDRLASAEQSRIAASHLKRILGADLPITALAAEETQQAYVTTRWQTERRSANTIAREITVLRAALHRAFAAHPHLVPFKIGYIGLDDLPVRDRWLTREEAARLLAQARGRHVRLYILVALSTGGRPEAILETTWDQIDFNGNLIHFKHRDRSQTSKRRVSVPMTPMLRDALREAYNDRKRRTDYVIEYGGFSVLTVKKAIKAAAVRAGLKGVCPIVLRHTAAVWMAQDGVPLIEIARILGHRDTRMVERHYAQYHPDFQGRGMRTLAAATREVAARATAITAQLAVAPQFHPSSQTPRRSAPTLVLEKPEKPRRCVVGATGIEPVTPTMSR